jgi:predicted acetyltransferase
MIDKFDYCANPCKTASLPFWKAKAITIPNGMWIVHRDDFEESEYRNCIDEPYFRLKHDLQALSAPVMPQGYSLSQADLHDFSTHINSCYDGISITEAELLNYTTRPVYDADLWLAVKDSQTGVIVATGIAELDKEIGEGVLEWIQVSESHRRNGLGNYIVSELLWRMKDTAKFATVSGQCHNRTNPEGLYRKCNFTGSDVWHILRKR